MAFFSSSLAGRRRTGEAPGSSSSAQLYRDAGWVTTEGNIVLWHLEQLRWLRPLWLFFFLRNQTYIPPKICCRRFWYVFCCGIYKGGDFFGLDQQCLRIVISQVKSSDAAHPSYSPTIGRSKCVTMWKTHLNIFPFLRLFEFPSPFVLLSYAMLNDRKWSTFRVITLENSRVSHV